MIAIKGMEMPKSCRTCEVKESCGKRYFGEDSFYMPSDCPLIKIVTCKDCKRWNTNDRYCRYIGNFTDEDFYCAGAERKE